MHVLIIEDEAKTGAYLNKGLSEAGFSVNVARDGETGLRLAIAGEVQRPLAAVVVGGLFTATASTLLLLPALYRWFVRHEYAV